MQDRTVVAAKAKIGSDPLLLVDRPQAGVALVTMNRPDTRNSLSLDMIDRLHSRFTRLASDRTVSAIVLAANGPAFCAGHDLKELTAHRADADKGLAFYTEAMTRCAAMMQAIVACPKPVIVAGQFFQVVAGTAVGGEHDGRHGAVGRQPREAGVHPVDHLDRQAVACIRPVQGDERDARLRPVDEKQRVGADLGLGGHYRAVLHQLFSSPLVIPGDSSAAIVTLFRSRLDVL